MSLRALLLCATVCQAAQNIPFLELLNSESVMQLAQVAAQLTQQTSQQAARNEKEIMMRNEAPQVKPISLDQRPSEIFGQAFTNLARPLKMQTLDAVEHPELLLAPQAPAAKPAPIVPMKSDISIDEPVQQAPAAGSSGNIFTDMFRAFGGSALMGAVMPKPQPQEQGAREIEIRRERMHGDPIFSALGGAPIQPESSAVAPVRATAGLNAPAAPDVSPFMQLANAFLKGSSAAAPRAEGVGTARLDGLAPRGANQALPSIKEVVPGANQNFGIPRGQGCLPFLGEFMQIAYGNCVKEADEAAYSSWSSELQSAVMSGKMDILRASRESCKRGAEREQCNQLRQAISNCDIMDSLQIATSLQRNLKRCEEISGVIDQNPITVMNQIGNLVNGEFAHGFLNNFLGGR